MDEYLLFRAARYCNAQPWEMAAQSVYWMNHALAFENAENEVKNKLAKKAEKRGGKNSPRGGR